MAVIVHKASHRARVADVLGWIDAHSAPLEAQEVTLAQAAGRVLADRVTTSVDVPPFDRPVVDGFALRSEDTIGASAYNPLPFRLIESADHLPPASAKWVHAGARLPHGADAVALPEQAENKGDGACCLLEAVIAGAFIERAGSDAARGSSLATAGRRLRSADIGLLAAANISQVPVVRQPRVRCLFTGRDVAEAGTPLPADAVHDATGPLLASLVARDGGLLIERRWVDRTVTAIRGELASSRADVVLVAGSSGPGPDDHAAVALREAGELAVHGVAVRPGETCGMGRTASGTLTFLLPGAPGACLWSYELFAGRTIRRLGGRSAALPFRSRKMITARKIVSEIGMTEVCPVQCIGDGAVGPVTSYAEMGIAAAAHADGFVIVPEGSEGYRQGTPVLMYVYDEASSNLAMESDVKP